DTQPGPPLHRDRSVVAGDGEVHDPLQQSGLATHGRVYGLDRDPGLLGDIRHGSRREATGEEQVAGCGHDASSRFGGGSPATRGVIPSSSLDKLTHSVEPHSTRLSFCPILGGSMYAWCQDMPGVSAEDYAELMANLGGAEKEADGLVGRVAR